jgi:hypothetical protein
MIYYTALFRKMPTEVDENHENFKTKALPLHKAARHLVTVVNEWWLRIGYDLLSWWQLVTKGGIRQKARPMRLRHATDRFITEPRFRYTQTCQNRRFTACQHLMTKLFCFPDCRSMKRKHSGSHWCLRPFTVTKLKSTLLTGQNNWSSRNAFSESTIRCLFRQKRKGKKWLI